MDRILQTDDLFAERETQLVTETPVGDNSESSRQVHGGDMMQCIDIDTIAGTSQNALIRAPPFFSCKFIYTRYIIEVCRVETLFSEDCLVLKIRNFGG